MTPRTNPTREEMDERLLDYLYGELETDERAAFERALPAFPEVQAELDRHRWTRQQMTRLPVVPLPLGALDAALAAAEQHAAGVAVEPRITWGERIRRFVMQPAFGVAFVALIAVGIGVSQRGGGGLEPTGAEQSVGMVPVEPVTPRHEQRESPDKRALDEAAQPAGAKAELAPAPAEAKPAEPQLELAKGDARPVLAEPAPPAPVVAPRAERVASMPSGGAEKKVDSFASVGSSDAPATDRPRPKPSAHGEANALGANEAPIGGVARGDGRADNDDSATSEEARGPRDPQKPVVADAAKPKASGEGGRREDVHPGAIERGSGSAYSVDTTDKAKPADAPANEPSVAAAPDPVEPRYAPAERVAETTSTRPPQVAIDDEAQGNRSAVEQLRYPERNNDSKVASDRNKAKDNGKAGSPQTDSESADKPRPDRATKANTPAVNTTTRAAVEERLWSTYGQQIAGGAYADAQATLDELAKLGETPRLKAAREAYKKQAEAAAKAEAERARNAPTKAPPETEAPRKSD